MNRDIKFRGKRIDNGEWIYGWLVIQSDNTAYISEHYKRGEWVEVDPKTVGQYTGMSDKNGKGIFEGDIIKSARGYNAVAEWVDDGRFLGFTIERERKIMYIGQESAVEIIGNVYENADLLGVKA